MKRLTERTEIAQAINFGKYPVIKIDLADCDDYGVKGTKVRIDAGKDYYIRATIRAFNDEKTLTFVSYGAFLSDRMSYEDMMEMVEYANAPIIKPGQEIVICLYNSEYKTVAAPYIVKTRDRVNPYCQTPMSLTESIRVIA